MRGLLSIIILIASLFCFPEISGQSGQKQITVEDIYQYHKFTPERLPEPFPMKDGIHFALSNNGNSIDLYSFKTGEKTGNLFDAREYDGINTFEAFEFDQTEKRILLTTRRENIYRHSYIADFYVFDLNKKILVPLSGSGQQKLAAFSPSGNMVAFVRNNNLYISDPFTGIEKPVTFDGAENEIINGAPDWVYEEEFGFSKGFQWSPDGKRIAFYRFDERHVKEFHMTMYNDLYPDLYRFKYPKAGERNAIVSIQVYDLETGDITEMDTGDETDQYIPRIKWTDDPEILSIIRLNRLQNHMEILHADAVTGTSEVVYEESNPYYISEASDHTVTYLPDQRHFILLSERDGYFHFYLYNFKEQRITPITSGEYDVAGFTGYDQKAGRLYYTSYESSPLEQHVFSIKTDGTGKRRVSSEKGFSRAVFSKNFQYYLLYHSSAGSPEKVTVHNLKGELIRIMVDNKILKNRMLEYGFSPVEFLTIPTESGEKLNAYMIKPADFNREEKSPLFIYVYGGPESQNVADRWNRRLPWFQLLARNGYIVACIDNRGTNGRGEAFRKATYMQMGKYETIDQVEAANYLAGLDFVDESRIGIFGWSYGGFMTSLCMTKGGGLYKIGIAVAPVTSWRFYDTIYTERFMRTPAENPDGYDDNSPINFAEQLEGKFLLVHGTADDNVHFQNSTEFAEALVQAGKQFEMQFYTNKNHGISGGNTTVHLYNLMTDFILENL